MGCRNSFTAGSVHGTGCSFAEKVEAVLEAVVDGKLELREHVSWPWGQRQTDAGTANRSMGRANLMDSANVCRGSCGPSYTIEESLP